MKTTRIFVTTVVLGGWSVGALAQTPTLGFPIGEKSRIHTNLDLGVAFDSNPGRLSSDVAQPRSDWRALIRPGLSVNVPGSAFSMQLHSGLSINQFFGVNSKSDTTFGGSVGLSLTAGSERSAIAFSVKDNLVRTPVVLDEPGTVASDETRFREWSNRGVAKVSLRPGGGAIEFNLGYTNEMSFYDNLPWSMSHGTVLEARWRFLPKTVAFFTGNFSFFSSEQILANNTRRSSPLTLVVGLSSALTARFAANASVGYADTLTWADGYFSSLDGSNSRTVVGSAQVSYRVADAITMALGYGRRVAPVILLNNFIGDSAHLTATFAPTMRLQFRLHGNYEHRGYGIGRNVHSFTGDARVDYWFFDFLAGGLSYRVLAQAPSNPSNNSRTSGYFLETFTRHQVFMNVGLRY
ncbi:MAG: hypothetical protein IPK13_06625 [Deltaproteobacteria bacterium]|nr:hypothetical protein [Deltaproteobacteria bacterium]